jgi:hypothetical protein
VSKFFLDSNKNLKQRELFLGSICTHQASSRSKKLREKINWFKSSDQMQSRLCVITYNVSEFYFAPSKWAQWVKIPFQGAFLFSYLCTLFMKYHKYCNKYLNNTRSSPRCEFWLNFISFLCRK